MSAQESFALTTFDKSHFMYPLHTVIHDPTLLLFFESILKNDAVFQTLLDKHIVTVEKGTERRYRPSYLLGCAGWTMVQTLSDIVFTAVHNIQPYAGNAQRPQTIPRAALEELGYTQLATPRDIDITRFHCLPNYLFNLVCRTPGDLRRAFDAFQKFLCRSIVWLTTRIHYSISKGFEARLNWGAYIGVRWDEYLYRVSPSTVIAEARRRGITADEVAAHYSTNDDFSHPPHPLLTHQFPRHCRLDALSL
ncbi:hypothetical protein EV421DRAFT_1900898 [Armillaria borealis]|uniref:Uncharacterized protein n=1 Tax=Armillaria borealis TaxID=47425 RepID=A0AA39JRL6_9AGAR|nr:hypothetical protein EV421DRAFT_1900898 [Armillaria borealis]